MSAPETVSMPRAEGGEFWAAVARTGLESEDRTEIITNWPARRGFSSTRRGRRG
jgi:hypothetical protein